MEDWFYFIGWILSVATVVGNGFIVLLIAKRTRLRSSSNWLVLSLALADFGVGVSLFPSGYLCGKIACNMRVYMASFWFFTHSSVTNLCTLTWDRYIAIVHPFKYITCMTARRPGIAIALAWSIPLAISLSLALGMYATSSPTAWKILRLTGVSAFDISACVLLFYLISRLLFVARRRAQEMSVMRRNDLFIELRNPSSVECISTCRPKKPKTKLFLTTIVTFFLGCHAVINSFVLYMTISSDISNFSLFSAILVLMLVINSAVNPLVYAFLKQDIKRELKLLVCGEKERN